MSRLCLMMEDNRVYVPFTPTHHPGIHHSYHQVNQQQQTIITGTVGGGDVYVQQAPGFIISDPSSIQGNNSHHQNHPETHLMSQETIFTPAMHAFQVVSDDLHHQQQMPIQSLQNYSHVASSSNQQIILVNGVKDNHIHHQPQQMVVFDVLPPGQTLMQVTPTATAVNVIEVQPTSHGLHHHHHHQNQQEMSSQFNLSLPEGTVVMSSNARQLEIVELEGTGSFVLTENSSPTTTLLLPQQQQTLQLTSNGIIGNTTAFILSGEETTHPHVLSLNPSVITTQENVIVADDGINQVSSLAKSWHSDSTLANRALTALSRTSVANTLPIQHLRLSSIEQLN